MELVLDLEFLACSFLPPPPATNTQSGFHLTLLPSNRRTIAKHLDIHITHVIAFANGFGIRDPSTLPANPENVCPIITSVTLNAQRRLLREASSHSCAKIAISTYDS
jgi:hypothetical protein